MKLDLPILVTLKELQDINISGITINKIINKMYFTFSGDPAIKDCDSDVLISGCHVDDITEEPYFITMINLKEFNSTKLINEAIYKQLTISL